MMLAIDPGVAGGFAFIDARDNTLRMSPFFNTFHSLGNLGLGAVPNTAYAVMEQVASSPAMGARRAFTFGRNVGQWEAVIEALGIAPDKNIRVLPQVWQQNLNLTGIKGHDRKKTLLNVGERVLKSIIDNPAKRPVIFSIPKPYPELNLETVDAFLMLMWGLKNAGNSLDKYSIASKAKK